MDVICYRGGGGEHPENTIEGIGHCYKVNPDWWVEIDLRVTADNQVVLLHDQNLKRLAGVDLRLDQLSHADLNKLNVGYHAGDSLQYRVPLLEEVFAIYTEVRFVLDIHDFLAVEPVLRLVSHYNCHDRIVVVSESDKVIRAMKQGNPKLTCGAGKREAMRLWLSSLVGLDKYYALRSDLLIIPASYLGIQIMTPRIIDHVQRLKKKVWIYSDDKSAVTVDRMAGRQLETLINSAEKYDYYIATGVDGVFTDCPELLKKTIEVRDL